MAEYDPIKAMHVQKQAADVTKVSLAILTPLFKPMIEASQDGHSAYTQGLIDHCAIVACQLYGLNHDAQSRILRAASLAFAEQLAKEAGIGLDVLEKPNAENN